MIRWFVAGPHLVQVRFGKVVKAKYASWLVGKNIRQAKYLARKRGLPFYEVEKH